MFLSVLLSPNSLPVNVGKSVVVVVLFLRRVRCVDRNAVRMFSGVRWVTCLVSLTVCGSRLLSVTILRISFRCNVLRVLNLLLANN